MIFLLLKESPELNEEGFPSSSIRNRSLASLIGQSGRALIRLLPTHFPRNLRGDLLAIFIFKEVLKFSLLDLFWKFSHEWRFSMENKMATPPGKAFSTAQNQVSQCDDQTFRSILRFLEKCAVGVWSAREHFVPLTMRAIDLRMLLLENSFSPGSDDSLRERF